MSRCLDPMRAERASDPSRSSKKAEVNFFCLIAVKNFGKIGLCFRFKRQTFSRIHAKPALHYRNTAGMRT